MTHSATSAGFSSPSISTVKLAGDVDRVALEFDVRGDRSGTDARADLHRVHEPHLVESVVDAHEYTGVLRVDWAAPRSRSGREVREHRQRQHAVRDRRTERRRLGPLRIDMNELMVVRDVGELVDLVLGDLEPLAGALVVVDVGLEQFECLACGLAHGAAR